MVFKLSALAFAMAITSSLAQDAPPSLSAAVATSLAAIASASESSYIAAMPTLGTFDNKADAFLNILQTLPPMPVSDPSVAQARVEAVVAQIAAANDTAANPPKNRRRAGAIKVMIVGDSMTHGQEGDWTWRYRMWQWFRSNGIAVDFVGPYSGTQLPTTFDTPRSPPRMYGSPAPPGVINVKGGYAADVDGAFDKDHFGVWGRPVAIAKSLIRDAVATYQPDLMLVMLGFNDLGWFYSDAPGLVNNMYGFISEARAANPNLKFAIGNVPARSFIGGRQDLVDNTDRYNSWIGGKLSDWSTSQSPIGLVDIRHTYSCNPEGCPAGYDGLHPASLGDYQIASAFSSTLNKVFGMGNGPLAIPSNPPARPVPAPSGFTISSSPQGVTAKWNPVYGAYGYHVQVSINGGEWSKPVIPLSTNRWDSSFPAEGVSYAVRVATYCGELPGLISSYTGGGSAVAHPQTPSAPRNVKAYSSGTDITVNFDPPASGGSITEYEVIVWDLDGCSFINSAGFSGSGATFNGLVSGHRYLVAAAAWNSAGQGFVGVGNNVRVGDGSTPAAVSGLQLTVADDNNIKATWSGSAVGYSVWIRNTLNSSDVPQKYASVDGPCWAGYVFYPATWCYEYCFEAWNGGLSSGLTSCIQPPAPSSKSTPGTCPPPAPWCPSYGTTPAPAPGPGDTPVGGGGSGTTANIQPSTTAVSKGVTQAPPAPECSPTTKTVIYNTAMVVCSGSTYRDPSPSLYSFQAQFTGNVAFGNINPLEILKSASSDCVNGCNGALATRTQTAYTLQPTNAPQPSQDLKIIYVATNNAVPNTEFPIFEAVIETIVTQVQKNETFTWIEETKTYDTKNGSPKITRTNRGKQTQYWSPRFVQGIRWGLDQNGAYRLQAGQFGISFDSEVGSQSIDCDTIAGPLGAALGLIPGIGPVLGLLGATACSIVKVSKGG